MLISLLLILLLTVGGSSLTYLFAEDEPFLWRVCAGNVVGSAVFGLVCFLLACFFGFTTIIISLAFLTSLAPLLLFIQKTNRLKFKNDWHKAKDKLEGANFKKVFRFAYYIFFIVLFIFFFGRAMLETTQGIFTGASQNLGDLPFHLGAIFSFTDGNNFPPENPSYAFAKFSYPFMADLIAASFVKSGAAVRDAMFVQNVFLAFSLLVVLERFAFKLTGNRLAGKIAPVLLFFSGGLGFIWFLKDYWHTAQSFFDFLWNLPFDYTIRDPEKGEKFRWGNSLVVLFITQRSLLLGMPLTIIALQKIWEIFNSGKWLAVSDKSDYKTDTQHSALIIQHCFLTGLLAGTLPLIHVHSLVVLFIVSAFLFFFRLDRWREWLAFGLGVSIIAVPELVWAMTGSATRLTEFIDWHFGWDKREDNIFWFWLKNTGAFIPVFAFGIYLIFNSKTQQYIEAKKDGKQIRTAGDEEKRKMNLLLFTLPFLLCFVIANQIKLAPWEWDNIKILIYWFVGSLPVAALAIAWLWNKNNSLKIVAAGCLIILTFAGALDVWRTVSGSINYKIFDKDAIAVAEQIKQKTAPNALFLNAPTYNSAVVLSGRRSLMRYSGHLSSYGIDYAPRENEVKRIYEGSGSATDFLRKNKVEYVLISPEEKSNLTVNEDFFSRFPVIAEAGEYRVYQIKK